MLCCLHPPFKKLSFKFIKFYDIDEIGSGEGPNFESALSSH